MATYYVGWDVGAWHCDKNVNSRDAIVIQKENSEKVFLFYGNAKNFFSTTSLDNFFKALFPNCIEEEQNEYNVAVDAVLGWPKEFIALITGKKINTKELPECKKQNHFLLRECERELPEDIQPLSAVQDMLGSQSTKVLFFLHKFDFDNQGGVWTKDDSKVYETYPAMIAKSLEEKDLPKVSHYYHQVSRESGIKSLGYTPKIIERQDFKDALLALAAIKMGFKEPETPINKIEGWIWLPKSE